MITRGSSRVRLVHRADRVPARRYRRQPRAFSPFSSAGRTRERGTVTAPRESYCRSNGSGRERIASLIFLATEREDPWSGPGRSSSTKIRSRTARFAQGGLRTGNVENRLLPLKRGLCMPQWSCPSNPLRLAWRGSKDSLGASSTNVLRRPYTLSLPDGCTTKRVQTELIRSTTSHLLPRRWDER